MKRFTLIILISLSFISIKDIQSQEYFPFPTDSAEWYVMSSWPEMIPPYVSYYTRKHKIIGDTIIDENTYHKLYSSGTDTNNTIQYYYYGAFRVEKDSQRVYYFDKWDTLEYLVYDYNLIPNDTVLIRGSECICLDTGSVILKNNIRHKFQYMLVPDANNCFQTWVIGLGSLGNPLSEPYWHCAYTFEWDMRLTCFYYKGEKLYEWDLNPYFSGCIGNQIAIGIDENYQQSKYNLYPNPVVNTSKLATKDNTNEIVNYYITDITGKIINKATGTSLTELSIQRNQFNPGLYILNVSHDETKEMYRIKFIVL